MTKFLLPLLLLSLFGCIVEVRPFQPYARYYDRAGGPFDRIRSISAWCDHTVDDGHFRRHLTIELIPDATIVNVRVMNYYGTRIYWETIYLAPTNQRHFYNAFREDMHGETLLIEIQYTFYGRTYIARRTCIVETAY